MSGKSYPIANLVVNMADLLEEAIEIQGSSTWSVRAAKLVAQARKAYPAAEPTSRQEILANSTPPPFPGNAEMADMWSRLRPEIERISNESPAPSRPTLPVHQDPRDAIRSPRQNRGGRT